MTAKFLEVVVGRGGDRRGARHLREEAEPAGPHGRARLRRPRATRATRHRRRAPRPGGRRPPGRRVDVEGRDEAGPDRRRDAGPPVPREGGRRRHLQRDRHRRRERDLRHRRRPDEPRRRGRRRRREGGRPGEGSLRRLRRLLPLPRRPPPPRRRGGHRLRRAGRLREGRRGRSPRPTRAGWPSSSAAAATSGTDGPARNRHTRRHETASRVPAPRRHAPLRGRFRRSPGLPTPRRSCARSSAPTGPGPRSR